MEANTISYVVRGKSAVVNPILVTSRPGEGQHSPTGRQWMQKDYCKRKGGVEALCLSKTLPTQGTLVYSGYQARATTAISFAFHK